jgi:hypothetical protein
MSAATLFILASICTPPKVVYKARSGSYAITGQVEMTGEFAGQERVSLVTLRNGKVKHLATLTHRWEHSLPDRIHVLGDHIIAELASSADTHFAMFLHLEGVKAKILIPFEDKAYEYFACSGVVTIGDCLVGCIWVTPDFCPQDWGNYMFVVTKKKVTWGRLPELNEGYSIKPGTSRNTFMLNYLAQSYLYRWPLSCRKGAWLLVPAKG